MPFPSITKYAGWTAFEVITEGKTNSVFVKIRRGTIDPFVILWILSGLVCAIAGLYRGTRLPRYGSSWSQGSVPLGIAGRVALVALAVILLYAGLRGLIH